MRALAVLAAACLSLAFAAVAHAQAEEELAERYAPVVRLVEQEEECGPGEPYQPIDIDAILDEDTVSLRGPGGATTSSRSRRPPTISAAGSTSTTSTSPAMRSIPAATTRDGRAV